MAFVAMPVIFFIGRIYQVYTTSSNISVWPKLMFKGFEHKFRGSEFKFKGFEYRFRTMERRLKLTSSDFIIIHSFKSLCFCKGDKKQQETTNLGIFSTIPLEEREKSRIFARMKY